MRLAIKKPMKISGSPLLIEPEWDVEDCEAMEESRTFCSKICCAGSVRRKRVVSVIETVERTQSEAAWTVGHELGVVNNRRGCINTHIFEVLTHFGSNGSYPGVIGTRWFPDLKRPSKIDVVARHPGEGGSSSPSALRQDLQNRKYVQTCLRASGPVCDLGTVFWEFCTVFSVSVSELTRRVCDFESKPFIDGQGSVTPSFNPFLSYYALAQDAESGGLAPEKADVLTCPGI